MLRKEERRRAAINSKEESKSRELGDGGSRGGSEGSGGGGVSVRFTLPFGFSVQHQVDSEGFTFWWVTVVFVAGLVAGWYLRWGLAKLIPCLAD